MGVSCIQGQNSIFEEGYVILNLYLPQNVMHGLDLLEELRAVPKILRIKLLCRLNLKALKEDQTFHAPCRYTYRVVRTRHSRV